jgi:hypothetical protein
VGLVVGPAVLGALRIFLHEPSGSSGAPEPEPGVLCRFCSEAGKQLTSLLPNGDEPVAVPVGGPVRS